MEKQEIIQITDWIKNNPNLSPIFGNRVWFGGPRTTPKETFLLFDEIDGDERNINESGDVEYWYEFRIVAQKDTSPLDVKDYMETLKKELIGINKDFGGVKFVSVNCLSDNMSLINYLERQERVKTFILWKRVES